MKTSLPERSLIIKDRLDRILEEILACQREKIAMIILFGSYARGDWVSDEYEEDGRVYGYHSDIDLLLVLKRNKYGGHIALRMEREIKNRLKRNLVSNVLRRNEPWISLVLEPIEKVNSDLEKSKYFFSDIKKEGVLLYDSREFELAEARELSGKERGEIAKEDYSHFYGKASKFLRLSKTSVKEEFWNEAAFLLHQK